MFPVTSKAGFSSIHLLLTDALHLTASEGFLLGQTNMRGSLHVFIAIDKASLCPSNSCQHGYISSIYPFALFASRKRDNYIWKSSKRKIISNPALVYCQASSWIDSAEEEPL